MRTILQPNMFHVLSRFLLHLATKCTLILQLKGPLSSDMKLVVKTTNYHVAQAFLEFQTLNRFGFTNPRMMQFCHGASQQGATIEFLTSVTV